jgi:tRNA1(Val) A37 N6-methylase TrmN6
MELSAVTLPFGKTIYQNLKGQPVSSDTGFFVQYILDHYKNENAKVLELGSGIGIISIMLGYYRERFSILGLEIQDQLVTLSKQNIDLCDLKNIDILHEDLVGFREDDKFDLIVTNPPYFSEASGRIPPNQERAISRFELKCKMRDVLETIKENLNHDGFAYIIYPCDRFDELSHELSQAKLLLAGSEIFGQNKNKKIVVEVTHDQS